MTFGQYGMASRISGNMKLAASLVVMGATIFAGVYLINRSAVERLLKQNARQTSMSVAQYFGNNLPDIDSILGGGVATGEARSFIASGVEARNVDVLKLYSPDGKLAYNTEHLEPDHTGAEELGNHNPGALEAIKAKRPFVSLETELENGHEQFIAETYVPVIRNGKVIGGAEVYINQTALANQFRQSFGWASAVIALLAAAGFAAPALGFHIRSRQKVAADESVRFLASHDALTGLANRANFSTSLKTGLEKTRGSNQLVALHFVDVDFFKEINDQYGHEFGDEVLRTVASRMRSTLRQGDIVSRFGGDEFVIAQFGIKDYQQLASATQRIVNVFKTPMRIYDRELKVTASIGTSVSTPNYHAAEQLIVNADTAVYVVKARGRNGHCFFEERFDEEKRKRQALENLVRDAVAAQRFELHYQPLVRLSEGRLKGFEALLRLRDNNGDYVPPAEVIPVAEETGLIDQIGSWVLAQACMEAAGWPHDLQVSVNLSAAQFRRRSVVDVTRAALANSGLHPSRLWLEITESMLLSEPDNVIEQLKQLKALGVSIVMDDFGTGYSSLSYLMKFPFDRIKIDRSFVTALAQEKAAQEILKTIVGLAATLHMSVTAEGVETEEQSAFLRATGCDTLQGYFFSRPLPIQEVMGRLGVSPVELAA